MRIFTADETGLMKCTYFGGLKSRDDDPHKNKSTVLKWGEQDRAFCVDKMLLLPEADGCANSTVYACHR
jgi:hypothetical protein